MSSEDDYRSENNDKEKNITSIASSCSSPNANLPCFMKGAKKTVKQISKMDMQSNIS